MRILVLGGTRFLGRHLVEAALARGHELTIFHRGRTGADLFAGDVRRLTGDRDGGLDALGDGAWDAVVDTCGYVPRIVRASAERLAGAVERYTFVSSVSVYPDLSIGGLDETAAVATLDDPATEDVGGGNYGGLKVACERAVEEVVGPDRTLVVRPGLIVGPFDPTDRFTYWPARLARGGRVLAPGDGRLTVQFIDARDLAAWIVDRLEASTTGCFNATGPAAPLSLADLLEACRRVAGAEAELEWVDEAFLEAEEVAPWTDLPLWVPPDAAGIHSVSIERALAAGLSLRPLSDTIRDTLAWSVARGEVEWQAGLAPEAEARLLARWRATGAPARRPPHGPAGST